MLKLVSKRQPIPEKYKCITKGQCV